MIIHKKNHKQLTQHANVTAPKFTYSKKPYSYIFSKFLVGAKLNNLLRKHMLFISKSKCLP